MAYQVHGEDISEEEFSQDQGWQSAGARRAGAKTRTADSNEPSPQPGSGRGKVGGAALKSKVLRAGKMPPLPRDDIKIVIRPRGGLNISKIGAAAVADAILAAAGISQEDLCHDTLCPNLQQNIMVASTPKRENASRYVRVKQILISGKVHELSAYETAPHCTCKGVIRNIPLQDDPDVIDARIVNTNNPLALAAKRIAETGTVIVAFDGYRVPNFVRYGPVLMQCSLYRKQIDVCYACGRLGHRADVCPTPSDMICRGCGVASPDEQHVCTPKCKLCGGQHLTASKDCARRFKIPYIVRRRRSERSKMAARYCGRVPSFVVHRGCSAQRTPPLQGPLWRSFRIQGPWCLKGMFLLPLQVDRTGSFAETLRFSASLQLHGAAQLVGANQVALPHAATPKSKKKPTLSWADKAREGRESPRGDDSSRGSPHAKELDELRRANEQLKKENAQFKQEMSRLAAEMAEIRRLASSPPSAQPASAPVAMDTSHSPHRSSAPKRRAVENTQKEETGNLLSELKDAFASMQATLAKIQEAMAHPNMGLGALSERIRKLEEGDVRRDCRPTLSQVAAATQRTSATY
ncbi:hypothetical protein HPB52_023713 [Rhipicephalus sanguineus]|uniref:CCHC-type domain-containing protein n=1 Tax=Rhipicephalus sanguineus TaxID=34632 RepID=A0A9D4TC56_RHISA|nr:hypothetical protein HPB52_023713 [Rhipicephalus sanguineus]